MGANIDPSIDVLLPTSIRLSLLRGRSGDIFLDGVSPLLFVLVTIFPARGVVSPEISSPSASIVSSTFVHAHRP